MGSSLFKEEKKTMECVRIRFKKTSWEQIWQQKCWVLLFEMVFICVTEVTRDAEAVWLNAGGNILLEKYNVGVFVTRQNIFPQLQP